ncbi:MAG: dockerin type I domain-containing protein [Nanoarchaeota archaeon]
MRKNWTYFILISLLLSTHVVSASPLNLSKNLVFHESFDNLSSIARNNGNIISDTSINASASFVPGIEGNAVSFDCISFNSIGSCVKESYVTYSLVNKSQGIIEFWFKPKDNFFSDCKFPSTGLFQGCGFFDLGKLSGQNPNSMGIFWNRNLDKVVFEIRENDTVMTQSFSNQTLNSTDWHHVVVVWQCNSENDFMQLFLDGVPGNYMDFNEYWNDGFCTFKPNVSEIWIGRNFYYGSSFAFIDEFKVYEIVKQLEVVNVTNTSELRIRKWGTTAVPGRTLEYFITVENIGNATLSDILVFEALEPWFTYVSAIPDPVNVTNFSIFWSNVTLAPGEFKSISYKVQLDSNIPLGATVRGQVCVIPIPPPLPPPLPIPDPTLPSIDQCDENLNTCLLSIPIKCIEECLASPIDCNICYTQEAANCNLEWLLCLEGTEIPPIPPTTQPPTCDQHEDPVRRPLDPNEKGVVANKFIQPDQLLVYPIHFENIGNVEALDIFITDTLDEDINTSTIEILTPNGNFDSETRTIKWELRGINLQPNETGTALFSVKPLRGLPSGTEIRNNATIQFEIFEPIITNETLNIIDDIEPQCTLNPLPSITKRQNFTISWYGADAIGEIEFFRIFVSSDGGNFTSFIATNTNMTFSGEQGKSYGFFCNAQDSAGNHEIQDVTEASTKVTFNSDINADCKVDITDLATIGMCFAQPPEGLCAPADLNSDGVINILDLATVGINFEKSC